VLPYFFRNTWWEFNRFDSLLIKFELLKIFPVIQRKDTWLSTAFLRVRHIPQAREQPSYNKPPGPRVLALPGTHSLLPPSQTPDARGPAHSKLSGPELGICYGNTKLFSRLTNVDTKGRGSLVRHKSPGPEVRGSIPGNGLCNMWDNVLMKRNKELSRTLLACSCRSAATLTT